MESIAPPTHDVVLVVGGGAIVTANAYVAYKYFLSLSSLLALNFESTSSQDLRSTRLTPLIRKKQMQNITGTEFLDETQQYKSRVNSQE